MTRSSEATVRIAAIGDLHVQETMTQPYRALFADMSGAADFILLCGDLTNYGKLSEAEVLAADLAAVTVPVVGVLGNHDHESGLADSVKDILTHAGVRILDGGEAFEIEG